LLSAVETRIDWLVFCEEAEEADVESWVLTAAPNVPALTALLSAVEVRILSETALESATEAAVPADEALESAVDTKIDWEVFCEDATEDAVES
jgi:hypothetical protein